MLNVSPPWGNWDWWRRDKTHTGSFQWDVSLEKTSTAALIVFVIWSWVLWIVYRVFVVSVLWSGVWSLKSLQRERVYKKQTWITWMVSSFLHQTVAASFLMLSHKMAPIGYTALCTGFCCVNSECTVTQRQWEVLPTKSCVMTGCFSLHELN